MKKHGFIFLVLFVFCFFFLGQESSPVDPWEQSLTNLSSIINAKLLNLQSEINSLQIELTSTTASLDQASKDLRISESERELWETRSLTLSSSLDSINQKYSDLLTSINVYKAKLEDQNKLLLGIGIAGAVIILLKIIAFILYARGIKTPRWLDIIL